MTLGEQYWRDHAKDYSFQVVIPRHVGTVPPDEFVKVSTGDFLRCPLRGTVGWGLSNETDLRALRAAHGLPEEG